MYFKVYAVHPSMKTKYAILNFMGVTATWMQMVERRGRIMDWDTLCQLVFDKYDKDQYQIQLKRLESLKQTRSVTEYQTEFEQLAHGILLYNLAYDNVYFITRFVVGLRDDIRAAIALHRPTNVDIASALALLQEEELNQSKSRPYNKEFSRSYSKGSTSE
jgi:hypothetical protein